GLGLTICKGIVEAHGGKIWIDKSTIEGTVVKFILPVNGSEEKI
ncbi:MAG: ATP-binding protein, partial [Nitrososphaeraceae archaeon]